MGKFLVQIDDDLFQPAASWNLAKKEVSGRGSQKETTWHKPIVQERVIESMLKRHGLKRVTVKFIEEFRPEARPQKQSPNTYSR